LTNLNQQDKRVIQTAFNHVVAIDYI